MAQRPLFSDEYGPFVCSLIRAATGHIDIAVFDWRWTPMAPGSPCESFNTEIQAAKRRGVRVRAIVQQTGLVRELIAKGIEAKKPFSRSILHTKLIIIDNRFVVCGSHNFTNNAFGKNFELSVLLDIPEEIGAYKRIFERLWAM
jgi:phosphatidylserine/phosphatidylglycerophosphate/cardiolipin synthase-like enzyme